MRQPRLRGEGTHFVHVISRIVDRRFIFEDNEKEYFCELVRRLSRFTGPDVGDVSKFMQELKQGSLDGDHDSLASASSGPARPTGGSRRRARHFTQWYNRRNRRTGTLRTVYALRVIFFQLTSGHHFFKNRIGPGVTGIIVLLLR
jgi:hypothetical protein